MSVITTVTGQVASQGFSVVLGAEPLLCAGPERLPKLDLPAGEVAFSREQVRIEHLGRLSMGATNLDDLRVDESLAGAALRAFAGHGGSAVVSLATHDTAWTPGQLARLSETTGVWIVRGAVSDETGVAGARALRAQLDPSARHAAGIVGVVPIAGLGAGASTAAEVASSITLHAEVARDAGVPLALGSAASLDELAAALVLVDEAGLARSRVLVTGVDVLIHDTAAGVGVDRTRLDRLIGLGAVCCFDDLGRLPTVRTFVSDHDIALAVLAFAEQGAISRVALSSGIRQKHRHASFGGNGLEFVPQQFLPYLRAFGADDDTIAAVGGANLAALLSRPTAGEQAA